MKKIKYLLVILLFAPLFIIESCGPVVFSSWVETPPPPWFYPNRVESVRYVYFPDYSIYYDLSIRSYIYFYNGTWVTVKTLPPRYSNINLNRSRFVRIKNYRGDNISKYHQENNTNRSRSDTENNVRGRRN